MAIVATMPARNGPLLFNDSVTKGLVGQWKVEFDTQRGRQKYVLRISETDSKLSVSGTAELDGQKREIEFKEAKRDGDNIAFVELLEVQDRQLRITYTGVLEGDTIKFHRAVGDFGSTDAVAERVVADNPVSKPTVTSSEAKPAEKPTAAVAASTAPSNAALKDVFADAFKVGVAVNRSITTGQAFRRSADEVANDVAHVKRHFNHVVAENEMKWQLIIRVQAPMAMTSQQPTR